MSADPNETGPKLPPKPEPPDASECCGSGCEPCVFDLYEDELERWEARVKRQWARWAQRQDPNP